MISIVRDNNLTSGAKVLLMFLTASGDDIYTYKDFEKGAGLSRSTVSRCLNELESGGYITKRHVSRPGSYQDYIFYSTTVGSVQEQSRKTSVYVQRLTCPGLTIGKVGVAANPEMRRRQQRHGSCFHHELLFSVEFDTHEDAVNVEQFLLSSLTKYPCDKKWLPNGYTETIVESEICKAIEIIKEKQNEYRASVK